ncbi:MAG: hypothetical protein PVG93_06300 [Phycisphaerales bacterium]|jgi:hypothetical protein
MKEIKKTLEIFKERWLEVAGIIVLYVALRYFNILLLHEKHSRTPASWVIMLVLLAFGLAGLIIPYGFQRTICLNDKKRYSPLDLLKLGAHFFWRMLAFGFLWTVTYFFLIWLIFRATASFIPTGTTVFHTAQMHPFYFALFFSIISLLLIKPVLFIPAIIIALDCKFGESFGFLKRCKLSKAIEPTLAYCIIIPLNAILGALGPGLKEVTSVIDYGYVATRTGLTCFLSLTLAVLAVRFVNSLDIIYNIPTEQPTFDQLNNHFQRHLQ